MVSLILRWKLWPQCVRPFIPCFLFGGAQLHQWRQGGHRKQGSFGLLHGFWISDSKKESIGEKKTELILLAQEADYRSTTELLAKTKKGDEKSLDNFIPKLESDFTQCAELLSHKIHVHERSYHYIDLLKAVMSLSMTSLKAAYAKEIASSVTAILNEKINAEKQTNAGKKKQGKKNINRIFMEDQRVGCRIKSLCH